MDPTLRAILAELYRLSVELDRLRVENERLIKELQVPPPNGATVPPEAVRSTT